MDKIYEVAVTHVFIIKASSEEQAELMALGEMADDIGYGAMVIGQYALDDPRAPSIEVDNEEDTDEDPSQD